MDIVSFIKKNGGRVKTLTVFFASEYGTYSEFSNEVDRLVKKGILKRDGKYGDYLVIKKKNIRRYQGRINGNYFRTTISDGRMFGVVEKRNTTLREIQCN